jgi:uncharacterized protein Yka (UPF0111/DUF47 family)
MREIRQTAHELKIDIKSLKGSSKSLTEGDFALFLEAISDALLKLAITVEELEDRIDRLADDLGDVIGRLEG